MLRIALWFLPLLHCQDTLPIWRKKTWLRASGWCHLWWATPKNPLHGGWLRVEAGLTPLSLPTPPLRLPSLSSRLCPDPPHCWAYSSSATPPISRPISQFPDCSLVEQFRHQPISIIICQRGMPPLVRHFQLRARGYFCHIAWTQPEMKLGSNYKQHQPRPPKNNGSPLPK